MEGSRLGIDRALFFALAARDRVSAVHCQNVSGHVQRLAEAWGLAEELSYVSFPRPGAELLFQVIGERSERSSVIINTNLDFSKWEEIFGDHMLAAALVDRLTFKSHILNMNAESYRLKQRQRAKAG